ncbi:hypothetical protein C8Q75DRAFT_39722 [Abortiporus biennis]|nr:hypothetical protein C8Q75DRAFT_39722 [Abortiporus biennis]
MENEVDIYDSLYIYGSDPVYQLLRAYQDRREHRSQNQDNRDTLRYPPSTVHRKIEDWLVSQCLLAPLPESELEPEASEKGSPQPDPPPSPPPKRGILKRLSLPPIISRQRTQIQDQGSVAPGSPIRRWLRRSSEDSNRQVSYSPPQSPKKFSIKAVLPPLKRRKGSSSCPDVSVAQPSGTYGCSVEEDTMSAQLMDTPIASPQFPESSIRSSADESHHYVPVCEDPSTILMQASQRPTLRSRLKRRSNSCPSEIDKPRPWLPVWMIGQPLNDSPPERTSYLQSDNAMFRYSTSGPIPPSQTIQRLFPQESVRPRVSLLSLRSKCSDIVSFISLSEDCSPPLTFDSDYFELATSVYLMVFVFVFLKIMLLYYLLRRNDLLYFDTISHTQPRTYLLA